MIRFFGSCLIVLCIYQGLIEQVVCFSYAGTITSLGVYNGSKRLIKRGSERVQQLILRETKVPLDVTPLLPHDQKNVSSSCISETSNFTNCSESHNQGIEQDNVQKKSNLSGPMMTENHHSKRQKLYFTIKRMKDKIKAFSDGIHKNSIASRSSQEETLQSSRELQLANGKRIRGEKYYSSNQDTTDTGSKKSEISSNMNNNSTLPSPTEVAMAFNVKPIKLDASVNEWKRAYRTHRKVLPYLHAFDSCQPPDSSLNLLCLWWKALSGNDSNSPVHDDRLSYDLLPSITRKIVSPKMIRWYPRLHHSNVELRTAFLDRSIMKYINDIQSSTDKQKKIRLISFGAGYDLRSIKFMERNLVDEVVEIDLPEVVEAKRRLLEQRLFRRRPWLTKILDTNEVFASADLNDLDKVGNILDRIFVPSDITKEEKGRDYRHESWHNIFVFEAVMIYLNEGIPTSLLNLVSSSVMRSQEQSKNAHLFFADRLENVPSGNEHDAKTVLQQNGWLLEEWCPKPGLARHMGSAKLDRS